MLSCLNVTNLAERFHYLPPNAHLLIPKGLDKTWNCSSVPDPAENTCRILPGVDLPVLQSTSKRCNGGRSHFHQFIPPLSPDQII